MRAADVMTHTVITVAPETSVGEAMQLMLRHDIGALPVVDGHGDIVGIVTAGDFLRRASHGMAERRSPWLAFLAAADAMTHAQDRAVADVMSHDPLTIQESTPLLKIVHLMEYKNFRRFPVLRKTKLVGIVSRSDLLRALASLVREARPASKDDASIRKSILSKLARKRYRPQKLNVLVRCGEVELFGLIADEGQRLAVRAAFVNFLGVRVVHDHLICTQPSAMTAPPPADVAKRKSRKPPVTKRVR